MVKLNVLYLHLMAIANMLNNFLEEKRVMSSMSSLIDNTSVQPSGEGVVEFLAEPFHILRVNPGCRCTYAIRIPWHTELPTVL